MKKHPIEKIEHFLRQKYRWIITVTMAIFISISLLNAANDSATFDEVAHIPAGYSYLTKQDMRLNPEHPPLIKDLAAFPLLFLHLNFDTAQKFWTEDINGQWDAGRSLLYQSGNNPDQIIFWSRVPIIIISVLLGLFIFHWVKGNAGIIAGLAALVFYSFDPNILGHNHYVTTDIGIAAFLTFSFYYFLKFIRKPSWKNVMIGGIFLGLLHLAKFSSIIALPIFALILFFYPLFCKINQNDSRFKVFFEYLGKGIVAFVISIFVIWVVYAFNIYKMPQREVSKTINYYFNLDDTNKKTIITHDILFALNGNTLTRPLSEYGLGVAMVFKRVAGGNGAYFLGEVSSTAFPAYFPVVFLIKETIPFLFLIIFSLFFTTYQILASIRWNKELWKTGKIKIIHFLQTGIFQYSIFSFIVLYAYLSVTGNLNIGFRHLFPIFPFMFILVAKKISDFIKSQNPKNASIFKIIFLIITLWIVAETLISYPYYMSYFNESVGGPKNGYNYVTDSNSDWGQDMKRLRNWIDKYNNCSTTKSPEQCAGFNIPENEEGKPIDKIHIDYFGGSDIFRYIGKDRAILWWDSKRPIEPGWYAISVNFRQGSIHEKTKTENDSYRWLLDYQPVDQVGTSILIYYVPEK
ncbi:MAG: Uncharacterized protein Athens071425_169 [Parcubacteria group bacterium Athens0714_25]|nr:MAG: Uncharacterized protein Athens071425_169 [Parcubacteria group bacterium Athens0714_25]